jgi:hypothetical protein
VASKPEAAFGIGYLPENPSPELFPITWNYVIEKESLKFNKWEHVLKIEKVEQLFRDMLYNLPVRDGSKSSRSRRRANWFSRTRTPIPKTQAEAIPEEPLEKPVGT